MVLDLVSDTARRLNERQPEIARRMSDLLARGITKLDEDQQLIELLYASVDANVKTIIHVLANNIPIEHLQPTTAAVEYALRLAQRDVPANSLVRAYHMGQDNLMEEVFTEIQRSEYDADQKLTVLQHISRVVYRYIDWISLYVLDIYEKERSRWISARGNVHSSLIHKIVSGQPLSAGAFEAETGYRLDQFHVGVVVWSGSAVPDSDDFGSLHRFVRELSTTCGGGTPIVTAIDRSTVWGWVPLGRHSERLDTECIRQFAARSSDCRVALGLPGRGMAGFKRTHEQAQAAWTVALASVGAASTVTNFGDQGVALVSMLAKDMAATRLWVGDVLGPLAAADENTEVLRETLRVFFLTGENYVKTAELMNLHRNTVKYRVGKALQDRTALASDRLDMALALQVCHLLGSKVLR